MSVPKFESFGERLKWARKHKKLKVKESVIPAMNAAGISVSPNRWYEWEKIGTENDARRRKMRLKEQHAQAPEGQPPTKKRETAYYPPWPDELAAIEKHLGISQHWLVIGTGEPFTHPGQRRASDSDPLHAELNRIYESITDEQKKALAVLIKPYKRLTD